jgi:2-polyprenyl-3-methyl-5-hydroxy-6-metoxy-1,4-benzoquinol methylase
MGDQRGREGSPGGVPCRACGSLATEPFTVREMMFGTREAFAYRECATCGSLTIEAVPDDLVLQYPASYYTNHAKAAIAQDNAVVRAAIRTLVAHRVFRRRSRLLPIAARVTRVPKELADVAPIIADAPLRSFDDGILDVGCGAQATRLASLRKLGFRRLLGVDPFIPADTTYAGVPVRKAYLRDVVGDTFRLVMFHHSLEHVPDPLETLLDAERLLEPGGSVLIRTPITGTHLWREYGTSWVELDAPRHLVVFSLKGLQALAMRAGFEIVKTTWDSGHWEFIASEQYRRDVSMFEAASWFVDQESGGFDDAVQDEYRALARRLNSTADAGRAVIWMRRIGDPPATGVA